MTEQIKKVKGKDEGFQVDHNSTKRKCKELEDIRAIIFKQRKIPLQDKSPKKKKDDENGWPCVPGGRSAPEPENKLGDAVALIVIDETKMPGENHFDGRAKGKNWKGDAKEYQAERFCFHLSCSFKT